MSTVLGGQEKYKKKKKQASYPVGNNGLTASRKREPLPSIPKVKDTEKMAGKNKKNMN